MPWHADQSLLVKKIEASDRKERMPPLESHKSLTAKQLYLARFDPKAKALRDQLTRCTLP